MDVAMEHGISDQTIYLWRKKFGQLEPAHVRRLRQLEQENAKLKTLLAERDLEIEVMKEIAAIGIGGAVTRAPLPHHRTCGSASGGSAD